jgi:hypothetical protein
MVMRIHIHIKNTTRQQDVASYFQVSDWTIRTLLVNNGILDRNDLDGEQFALAA